MRQSAVCGCLFLCYKKKGEGNMLNVFYNSSEASEFKKKCIDAGGTAEVHQPDPRKDYYEVQWTHNKNKLVKQIIFGYPLDYDVIETLRPAPNELPREFDRRCDRAYMEAMHRFETPNESKKIYLIGY